MSTIAGPGAGNTLRVNSRATLSIDPALLASFTMAGRQPRPVVVSAIDAV